MHRSLLHLGPFQLAPNSLTRQHMPHANMLPTLSAHTAQHRPQVPTHPPTRGAAQGLHAGQRAHDCVLARHAARAQGQARGHDLLREGGMRRV